MIKGKCECGKVRFEIDGEIEDFSHCHCSQCRRMHGAAFGTFAGVKIENFRYTSPTDTVTAYESAPSNKRYFCNVCGSNILGHLVSDPERYYVAMGVIDGNPEHPEEYHIWVGSKAPWYTISGDAPQYEEEP